MSFDDANQIGLSQVRFNNTGVQLGLYRHKGKPLFELAKKRNVEGSRCVEGRNAIHRSIAEYFNYGKQNRKIKMGMACSLRCLSKNK